MIEAKKALWEKGLKDIVKTCVIMHNCFSKKLKVTDKLLENLDNIYINWGNALSILETDKTDQIIKKVEAGLMSRKRALMILENMNGQDAETEIDLIDQDA
jgi:hypothetical protein